MLNNQVKDNFLVFVDLGIYPSFNDFVSFIISFDEYEDLRIITKLDYSEIENILPEVHEYIVLKLKELSLIKELLFLKEFRENLEYNLAFWVKTVIKEIKESNPEKFL